jgi:hypothetical protein
MLDNSPGVIGVNQIADRYSGKAQESGCTTVGILYDFAL